MDNFTTRFSNRADAYALYRPGYPADLIPFLRRETGLAPDWIIADIGSGTGISTELFLKNGNPVYAVEPNQAMRSTAEHLLTHYPNFRSVDGTAEETQLAPASIELIISAQAFHWFDRAKARREFRRIAKPGAPVVLLWNDRRLSSEFEQAYERFIHAHAIDYEGVKHRDLSNEEVAAWFSPNVVTTQTFDNEQVFDFAGLLGRVVSSSYMPTREHPGYGSMVEELRKMFDEYQIEGRIRLGYDTRVYLGSID